MNEINLKSKQLFLYEWKYPYSLLYSPLIRKAVWIETNAIADNSEIFDRTTDILSKFTPLNERKNKIEKPEDYSLLTVLPNQKCNLHCSYCYSAAGRSNKEIKPEILKKAIDFFILSKSHDYQRPLTISFMGGGEPMLSWETVKSAIVYARSLALNDNRNINVTVITNGTLLTPEMLRFIIENKIDISISFEIIEEVQNLQRGKYKQIVENIKTLIDNGIIPQINSTITPANACRQLDMAEIADTEFPAVRHLMFEPVIAADMFDNVAQMEEFYFNYTDNFLLALNYLRNKEKRLTSFPYLRTVYPVERACQGELCLTPDGKISGCYCLDSDLETGFNSVVYGNVLETGLQYDSDKYRKLLLDNVYARPACHDCEVKWNCGGGCLYHRIRYGDLFDKAVCSFIRNFVSKTIIDHFLFRFRQQTGILPNAYPKNELLTKIIDY